MPVSIVRLPSLDLIKGFVAVGRRLSITEAANDLCVTQSAMSKQIRALESHVGTPLLDRRYRSISLTEEGERLFRAANASIQQLQDVLATVGQKGRRPVTITTSIGTAALWLLPRLGDFQKRFPEIDVRVAASNTVLDLEAEEVDIAIRYCSQAQAPHGAVRLFGEYIAPVASPALSVRDLDTVEDLRNVVLLEYEDRRQWLQWGEWLAARGWNISHARGVLRFNQYDQAIQAAAAGQGVALGRLKILGPMLEDGRLQVVPSSDGAQRTHFSYWLVQAGPHPREDVLRVAQWIQEASALADSGAEE
jgi:LysR family transcriptional regulator, glycine cleavage system transcriptional activator